MDLVEVSSFLLMLSTMELGRVCVLPSPMSIRLLPDISQEYSTESLSATQLAMLADLRNYGLIWQRNVSRSIFI